MKPPLVVGNWKMHGTESEAIRLVRQIRMGDALLNLRDARADLVCGNPPFGNDDSSLRRGDSSAAN